MNDRSNEYADTLATQMLPAARPAHNDARVSNAMKKSRMRPTLPALLALAIALPACSHTHTDAPSAVLASIPGEGFTLYAAGDIAECEDRPSAESAAARTAALVLSKLQQTPSAVVLTLGDHAYLDGTPTEFNTCYGPTWGQFKARTHPAPGNHEYRTPGAAGYFDYFGAQAGPERRGYYSLALGQWQVLSLNSYLQPAAHAVQLAWLKSELAAHPHRCTLAYWHHPVFSSGGHGNDKRMKDVWDVLQAAHAELILTGHDHDYERFAPQDSDGQADPQGIREFVVGTGGAGLTPMGLRKANSESGGNDNHGVLQLVLKPSGYEWTFLPLNPGQPADRGAALCH